MTNKPPLCPGGKDEMSTLIVGALTGSELVTCIGFKMEQILKPLLFICTSRSVLILLPYINSHCGFLLIFEVRGPLRR